MATPAQRIGAAAVVLALIAIAFLIRPRATTDRHVPRPGPLGIGAFLVSSIFVAVPEDWTGFGLKIALTVIAATALTWWGRGTTWGAAHRYAVAAGALVTYTWLGWILVEKSPGPLIAHGVLTVLTWAFLFVVRQASLRVGS